jgi:hypothetical protein
MALSLVSPGIHAGVVYDARNHFQPGSPGWKCRLQPLRRAASDFRGG